MTDTPGAPGTLALVELHAGRPDLTIPFYEAVVGWTFEQAEGLPVWTVRAGVDGPVVAALIPRGDAGPEVGAPVNGVVARVNVPDVDAAMAKALELGGVVALPATDYPGVARVGYVIDPDHNVVGLTQPLA